MSDEVVGSPPHADRGDVVAAIQQIVGALRGQADLLRRLIGDVEAVLTEDSVLSDAALARIVVATERYSLDCAIKVGWAVRAVARYRESLDL